MKNIPIQLFTVLLLFFGTWYGLSRIDWRHIYKIDRINKNLEEKLGDQFWDFIKETKKEIRDKTVAQPVDSILSRLCTANSIDKSRIKLHIVEDGEVNAFALPNGHLVINTGLINACDNDYELAGVIGHELAHIQKNHVMKKLIKEIGLSALIAVTTGGKGGQVIQQGAKLLSSTAYDRALEKEADISSVDYMIKADINPEGLANLMYKIAGNNSEESGYLSWINTHPDSKERAEYIIDYGKDKQGKTKSILSAETWQSMKASVTKQEPAATN